MGLDPRNLKDQYADYWEQNVNQSLINWSYCLANPKKYPGYGATIWGLTASDNPWGYSAHSPTNDLGVITPTAAISSIAYTPTQSLNALKTYYYFLGDRLWGDYGFYDALKWCHFHDTLSLFYSFHLQFGMLNLMKYFWKFRLNCGIIEL